MNGFALQRLKMETKKKNSRQNQDFGIYICANKGMLFLKWKKTRRKTCTKKNKIQQHKKWAKITTITAIMAYTL